MKKSVTKFIDMFPDGSCIKSKGKKNKCGYGVYFPDDRFENISRVFTHEPLTSPRTELYAIYKGILQIRKITKNTGINIYSDNEYAVKTFNIWLKDWKAKGWKTSGNKIVANQDIIKKIDKLISKHKAPINFIHIYSHTNKKDYFSLSNDIADKLAKKGALEN